MNVLHLTLTLGLVAAAALQEPETPSTEDDGKWTQEELERETAKIQAEIEELRGQKFSSPVKVLVTDEKGLVEYAKARIGQTETEASLHADEMVLKLLGLMASDEDYLETTFELLEGQVGGFYDPQTDTFYLMDRFTGGLARIILSHELTHALDDQLYDIDGTLAKIAGTTDAELAYHSVVEGSGLGTMNQWMRAHKDQWTMNDLLGAQELSSGLDEAPAALWKPLLGSYWLGVSFLKKTEKWRSVQMSMGVPEVASVKTGFARPPRSTEQILHPDKYWVKDSADEPLNVRVMVAESELPEGWEVTGRDTLGELYLALVTTPASVRDSVNPADPATALAVKFTNEAAEGWGGDSLVLLEKDDASYLHLVTAWDTERDAVEFEEQMLAVLPEIGRLKDSGEWSGETNVQRDGAVVQVRSHANVEEADLEALPGTITYSVSKNEER